MSKKDWSIRTAVAAVVFSFAGLTALPPEAEAKRLGGGGSFGRTAPSQMQKAPTSPTTTPSKPAQQQATSPTAAGSTAGAAAQPRNRFLGPLGGLAAGLGLAALFSYMGFGGALAEMLGTILMIGLVVFAVMFLVRKLRGQAANQPRPAYGTASGGASAGQQTYRQSHEAFRPHTPPVHDPVPGMGSSAQSFDSPASAAGPVKDLPPGFDEAGFVNSAKKFFITMQGLYDKGDVNGLREYCSDEVVEQLRSEIETRAGANRTDVVMLEAALIGFEIDVDEQLATVSFNAMLREEEGGAAHEVQELWIMSRPVAGGGWVLAGIHNL
ncbi:MAG TPA: TIM44-like domain-containing protein [Limnobacter sp.]|nr:TIM44-like domain-containing protein [Limnobacter sp.]